jgi:cytoskeletal protein RodZ
MTNKILKFILLILVVIFLIAVFIFISTLKDKQAEMTDSTASTTQTQDEQSQGVKDFFLTVRSPVSGTTQSSKSLTVKGKTTAGAEVFVNDTEGKANTNGDFSINITLDEGENTVLVIANDSAGNSLEKELTVTVVSFQ